jgi:hypothetical protein
MDAFLHTLVYNPNLTLPNPPSTSPDPNLYRKFIPGGRPFGPFCTIPWSNANTTDQHDCVRCALPARECALQRLHHEEVRVLTSARGPASVTTAYLLGLISSAGPRIARVLLLLATGKLTLRAARLQVRHDPNLGYKTRRKSTSACNDLPISFIYDVFCTPSQALEMHLSA